MALEMVRQHIDVERLVGEGWSQAMVEGNVLVPGTGREAARVLLADGRIHIGTVEVQSDRVALDGQVLFTVLYTIGEEANIQSMEASCAFNHTLDVPGASGRMVAEVLGELEHVEAECIGGRITLRAVAALRARVKSLSQVACIETLHGIDALETQKLRLYSLHTASQGESRQLLREEFELSAALQATDALYCRAVTRIQDVEAQEGRILVQGDIMLEALLASGQEGRALVRSRHTMPFEQSVEAPGCHAGLATNAQADVQDMTIGLLAAEGDSKQLRVELVMVVEAQAIERVENEVLVDAYSASTTNLQLSADSVVVRSDMHAFEGSDSIKASLTLPTGQPTVGTALAAFARPVISSRYPADGRTYIEGVLDVTLLYMPIGGSQPLSLSEEVPFRAAYPAQLRDDAWIRLIAEDTEIIPITADRLELKCNLRAQSVSYDTATHTVAVDALVESESQPHRSGITLYFAQPGDTLWTVAKRFATAQETIRHFNPEIEETLQPGKRVLLYHKPVFR